MNNLFLGQTKTTRAKIDEYLSKRNSQHLERFFFYLLVLQTIFDVLPNKLSA